MKRYVLGLAFTENNSVVMVQKNRPDWQAGKLNFIGGKVEPGENPFDTMTREFFEETGVKTDSSEWTYIGSMVREKPGNEHCFEVSIYVAGPSDKFLNCRTMEDEEIIIVPRSKFTIDRSLDQWYISNIRTIYEFATSMDRRDGAHITIEYP